MKDHEVIGTDVLALYHALQNPELVLGAEMAAKIRAMDPTAWYPIAAMYEPMQAVQTALGATGLRKIGRTLCKLSHGDKLRASGMTAEQLLHAFDGLYRKANRGRDIGGWRVLRFDENGAEIENNTPHDCFLAEGVMTEALALVGALVRVEQTRCVTEGGQSCIYTVTPAKRDHRWMKR